MNLSRLVPGSLLLSLALTACPFPIHVGDNPDDGPEPGSSSDTGMTTDVAPTTSGEPPGPAVCGDGIVDDGEPCDDGDTDPEDGCDAACTRTGKLEWTYTPVPEFVAADLTVDGTGRTILAGGDLVVALDSDGKELWRRTVPEAGSLSDVVVDAAGNIYVGGGGGLVHGLDPDGHELWRSGDEPAPDAGVGIAGLTLTATRLYSLTNQASEDAPEMTMTLRSHDLAAGTVLTTTPSPPGLYAFGEDLAASDDKIVVVGYSAIAGQLPGQLEMRKMVAAYTLDSTMLVFDVADEPGPLWRAVAATGDGGFVLTGHGPTPEVTVRRLGADLEVSWSRTDEPFFGKWVNAIAAGPGDAIAIAGHGNLDRRAGFVRRFTGAGDPLWTSVFESPHELTLDEASAVAFGPDFLVALGHAQIAANDPAMGLWVRRFALD